jgi:hypothetical protein
MWNTIRMTGDKDLKNKLFNGKINPRHMFIEDYKQVNYNNGKEKKKGKKNYDSIIRNENPKLTSNKQWKRIKSIITLINIRERNDIVSKDYD